MDRVHWLVPYRWKLHRDLEGLRAAGLLDGMFWLRITAICTYATLIILSVIAVAFPNVDLPWGRMALIPVIGPGMIATFIAIMLLTPSQVDVRRKWIQLSRGSGSMRIRRDQISHIEMRASDGGMTLLEIEWKGRSDKTHNVEVAVSPSVNRSTLSALLRDLTP